MPYRDRKSPMSWKDRFDDASIRGWTKRARRRVVMKQFREVWRSCTRDNMEVDENYFVLKPAADW